MIKLMIRGFVYWKMGLNMKVDKNDKTNWKDACCYERFFKDDKNFV